MIVEEWAGAGNLWMLMAAAAGGMLTEHQLVNMVLEPLVRYVGYGSLRWVAPWGGHGPVAGVTLLWIDV